MSGAVRGGFVVGTTGRVAGDADRVTSRRWCGATTVAADFEVGRPGLSITGEAQPASPYLVRFTSCQIPLELARCVRSWSCYLIQGERRRTASLIWSSLRLEGAATRTRPSEVRTAMCRSLTSLNSTSTSMSQRVMYDYEAVEFVDWSVELIVRAFTTAMSS